MNIPQGPWYIDDLLTFTVITTKFDTGVATDADAVPSYRVYEDETSTPILTGNMALLDSANTAGFYSEQITLSAANGFEVGKSYSIYVAATVNSVAGASSGGFKVIATKYPATIAAGDLATDSVTAASVKADAVTKIQAGLSTYAGGDTSGTTTLLSRLSSARAGYLDNLSAGAVALEASLQGLIATIGASAAGVATAVWGAATRILTAGTNIVLAKGTGVTGFNDLSAAQVNAEADTALADYDAPTKAELDSAVSPLATSASISALNNLSSAQAQTAAAAALAAFGSFGIKKNTAKAAFPFLMTDSTNHLPATGLTVTAQRMLDGGSFATCANSVVEDTNGWYHIDLAAADLNGDTVALKFTATGADALNIALVTGA